MATNMENRNIQQALSRYNMRNNDYMQPDTFRYGRTPIVRTDRSEMAMNNRAIERRVGGNMGGCGCGGNMYGGAVNSVLSEMDERFDGITNKNFSSPYRKPTPQYIQNGQLNFVPYYNMIEMAQVNSRDDADNVLRGRGIDYGKYVNQAKNILGNKVKDQVVEFVKPTLNQVKTLMKDPEVKQLAQDAINDPEVRKAVGKILNDAKDLARGGSIYSAIGNVGAKALTTGAKVGSTALKYGATAAKAGAKYGATAVAVGSKYGAKGVAVASAVANNKVVQKIASDVAENPAVQEAVVGLIASQIARIAPTPAPAPEEEEEEEPPTGGRFRGKKGGMIKIRDTLKKLKTKLKGVPDLTQITLQQYRDDDDVFGINSEEEDEDYEEAKKKVKHKKPDVEMKDLRSGSGMKGGKNKRALIVKKVMKEKGLGLIEASKYVKAHGLY